MIMNNIYASKHIKNEGKSPILNDIFEKTHQIKCPLDNINFKAQNSRFKRLLPITRIKTHLPPKA